MPFAIVRIPVNTPTLKTELASFSKLPEQPYFASNADSDSCLCKEVSQPAKGIPFMKLTLLTRFKLITIGLILSLCTVFGVAADSGDGAVYVMTNKHEGNSVQVFKRGSSGGLRL